jgi:hypothetical protein
VFQEREQEIKEPDYPYFADSSYAETTRDSASLRSVKSRVTLLKPAQHGVSNYLIKAVQRECGHCLGET